MIVIGNRANFCRTTEKPNYTAMKRKRKKVAPKTAPVGKEQKTAPVTETTNKKATTDETTDVEKKVQKKSYLPASYLALSELGKNLLQKWPIVFPNLSQLPMFSLQQLSDTVNDLSNSILQTQALDNDKKANTLKLAKANRLLNTGVTKLRQYVRDEFADLEEQAVQLAYYALVKDSKDLYILPTDNNSRRQALPRLIAYFANSPFVNRNFGLAQWQAAESEHATHWAESERLRSERGLLTANIANLYAQLKEIAKHIYQYIKVAFPAEQVAARRREIGFLKESF